MFQPNFCTATDFYKFGHWCQYPKGMDSINSYCEAREGALFHDIVWNGILPILKDFFEGDVITRDNIEEANEIVTGMGGHPAYFNRAMWEEILTKHNGRLPLSIKALPEGTVVPPSTPLFCITNTGGAITQPLVNHSETLLMHVWSSTTVASVSRYIKKNILDKWAKLTGTPELTIWQLHDFGFRGVSSWQTAVYSGMGHLITCRGTDTSDAVRGIRHYYGTKEIFGNSVWATEHSVATSYGPGRGEVDYVLAQLNAAPDDAIVSMVMDSYDTFNFAQNVVGHPEVLAKIKARSGRTVFRPDSGDPVAVNLRVLDILGNVLGFTVNGLGYKVLNHNVGVLQGDGMDYQTIDTLFEAIITIGHWSSDNLVVGSGGGLLQKWNRDTLRFAIKASHGSINGVGFDIFKDPATANVGNETKASKRGLLKVAQIGNTFTTISSTTCAPNMFNQYVDAMEPIFLNGDIMGTHDFNLIKKRAI